MLVAPELMAYVNNHWIAVNIICGDDETAVAGEETNEHSERCVAPYCPVK